MTIRSHLVLLVGAALLPILILATILTGLFWREQRETFYQRYLDGVRVMTIALESEIEASVRVMQAFALTPDIDHEDLVSLAISARRVVSSQPTWSTLGLVNAAGSQLVRVRVDGEDVHPVDVETVRRAIASGQPAVSPLLGSAGSYSTEIAVPIIRHGTVTHALVAGIAADVWLRFLSQYPVPAGATVTINDQNGVLVARTLDPERWVGRVSSSAFLDRTRRAMEGAFRITGVDGQHFYTAFKRSERWGWIIGTGVPVSDVERAFAEARALLARRQDALNSALVRERLARADAERASRGKDEFLAMLGHELRNPLGAITSAVTVLHRAGEHPDTVARAQEIIRRQVAVLTNLVDDLLDVARVTTGKIVLDPVPLELAQAVRHAIDVLAEAGRLSKHTASSTSSKPGRWPTRLASSRSLPIWSRTPRSTRRRAAASS
jgi:signal transduction histidine kinase